MSKSTPPLAGERRSRWWTALGGTVAFAVVGLALVPGLAINRPTGAPAEQSPEAPAQAALPAQETRESDARLERRVASGRPAPASGSVSHEFDCIIQPSELVDIGSAISGLIESIDVERSDFVEAGQVIARLESSVEEAAVRVAEARAERKVEVRSSRVSRDLGKIRRRRAQELFDEQTLSTDQREGVETEATLAALEVEQAIENRRIAALELTQARAALERRTIRSPISGFVVERLMAPGEVVDEEPMLRLAQVDPLRVDVILPSHLFHQVRVGDSAEILPEAPLDQARAAEVAVVDRMIDGASGTFGARLLLPNAGYELPAGLRCEVSFAPPETRIGTATGRPTEDGT